MNQKHLDLADKFNKFAYDLVSNEQNIKKSIISLEDDIFYRRVIFNKYYYALYHKYLAYDEDLSQKSGSSKHNAILSKIKSCNDDRLFQVFSKLLNLRVWADYKLEDNILATTISLQTLNQNVWSIIKRDTLV